MAVISILITHHGEVAGKCRKAILKHTTYTIENVSYLAYDHYLDTLTSFVNLFKARVNLRVGSVTRELSLDYAGKVEPHYISAPSERYALSSRHAVAVIAAWAVFKRLLADA